jgi:hypothetical protein
MLDHLRMMLGKNEYKIYLDRVTSPTIMTVPVPAPTIMTVLSHATEISSPSKSVADDYHIRFSR